MPVRCYETSHECNSLSIKVDIIYLNSSRRVEQSRAEEQWRRGGSEARPDPADGSGDRGGGGGACGVEQKSGGRGESAKEKEAQTASQVRLGEE